MFGQTADERDRKLQSLAGVHRHDPDFIAHLTRALGKTEIHLTLSEFFDISYKMKQSAVTGLLICNCLVHQQIKVRSFLSAAF